MLLEKINNIVSATGCDCRFGESLAAHTGFRTGGDAAAMFFPKNTEELAAVVRLVKKHGLKHFVLGNGSNVVARDSGYEGVVICTKHMKDRITAEKGEIRVSAGIKLADLCEAAAASSLTGLEFAFGIPGTVGGAIYMNAGAYGGEIKDVLYSVTALCADGSIKQLTAAECELGYRSSVFQREGLVILEAVFRLALGEQAAIRQKMAELMGRRKDKQPLNLPSCGSTFKRPEGAFAGALIEQCGLKGFRIGGAGVSEKHAGFVVNNGGATTGDILSVISHVQQTVLQQTGFELKCEVGFME